MSTAADATSTKHQNAIRFFWAVLIGATIVSLAGNVIHAVLPYVPTVAVQVAPVAVPPIVLLVAMHGIALAVRAGGHRVPLRCRRRRLHGQLLGASRLDGRDRYSSSTAWISPLIIDTAVAVSTVMLVALGDKPQPRGRTAKPHPGPTTQASATDPDPARSAKPQAGAIATQRTVQAGRVATVQSGATDVDAEVAAKLVATKVTTQPVDTVAVALAAHREGASINAAAKAAGVNYRTAQRIINGTSERSEQSAVAC